MGLSFSQAYKWFFIALVLGAAGAAGMTTWVGLQAGEGYAPGWLLGPWLGQQPAQPASFLVIVAVFLELFGSGSLLWFLSS